MTMPGQTGLSGFAGGVAAEFGVVATHTGNSLLNTGPGQHAEVIVPPHSARDLLLVMMGTFNPRHADTLGQGLPPGWTRLIEYIVGVGSNSLTAAAYYRIASSGNANPTTVHFPFTGPDANFVQYVSHAIASPHAMPIDAGPASAERRNGSINRLPAPDITVNHDGSLIFAMLTMSDTPTLSHTFAGDWQSYLATQYIGSPDHQFFVVHRHINQGPTSLGNWQAVGSRDNMAAVTFAIRGK